MAHNFKKTGAYYISKSGHDSNDGLTPDTPKRSLFYANNIIIGAGYYTTPPSQFGATGDGKVIVDLENTQAFMMWPRVNNVEYRNATGVVANFNNAYVADAPYNNIFRNMQNIAQGYQNAMKESIFIDSVVPSNSVAFNCILINSHYLSVGANLANFHSSYFDRQSTLAISTIPFDFRCQYINIQGVIKMAAENFNDATPKQYAVKDLLIGTPQDNGYALGVNWINEAQLTADGYKHTIVGWNNVIATWINRNPLFNNVSIEDFTLQAGSPHIGRGYAGINIGATNPAISVYNTSNGTSQIIPSAEIDTTNPNSYTVKAGFTEGYIDYIEKVGSTNLVLKEIDPITAYEFNSDIAGGNVGNRNVPDSEPLTFEYPAKLTTTSAAANTTTINKTAHGVTVGQYIRYAGQDREVTAVTADVITVASPFRAAVPSGVAFQAGDKVRIGALNPNRLTFMMRTSKSDNPQVDGDWDNDIDPVYGKAGSFLTQEWGSIPGYYIDSLNNVVWGSGDSETPQGLVKNEISCKWMHIRVYIRNNYES